MRKEVTFRSDKLSLAGTLLISEISPNQTEVHIVEDMDHMLRCQKEEPSILSYAASCSSPMMQEVNERIYAWLCNQKANLTEIEI